jgi:hypothetical protein
MPFPEPETALPATIVAGMKNVSTGKISHALRLAARPTNYQRLPRSVNHFHEDSTTYKRGEQPNLLLNSNVPSSRGALRARR